MTVQHRVAVTPAALSVLTLLTELHGEIVVHQAGGPCAGSAPMCHPVGDFRAGQRDVAIGEVSLPTPLPAVGVWVADDLVPRWQAGARLDVVEGQGSGFGLEAPEGVRLVVRDAV